MAVYRVYTEKKPGFDVEAKALRHEIRHILLVKNLSGLRILNRYDIEGIDRALFTQCLPIVFFEPQTDAHNFELPEEARNGSVTPLAVESLPGQFDVRAASCEECVQLVSRGERPSVRTAKLYLLEGELTADDLLKIKKHLINPVESREADLAEKATLRQQYDAPDDVEILTGFTAMDEAQTAAFVKAYGLAMDVDDLRFCIDFFKAEHRDPSLTEVRMLDTYWSDHCRHTTFLTALDSVEIEKPAAREAYARYLDLR